MKNLDKHTKQKKIEINKKTFVKHLLNEIANDKYKPQDDFYDYTNYLWLKYIIPNKLEKYIIKLNDFTLVQDKVFRDLEKIIVDYFKNNNNKLAKNLKNFYMSTKKLNSKSYSRLLAKQAEKLINEYTNDQSNPWKLMAYINSDEMIAYRAPFEWSLHPDDKDPDIFRCCIYPHTFAFLDLSVYYDDGTNIEYKRKYRKKHIDAIQTTFNTILGPNNYKGQDVFDVGVELFNALGCIDITSKEEKQYNRVESHEAFLKYGFDWDTFSKELGFKKVPSFFITSSLNYLKCGSELLVKNWNTPKWKTYWLWILLSRITRITEDWNQINFKLYGKFEKGQQEIISTNISASSITYMTISFNTFLTNQYIEKYLDPQAVEYIKTMTDDLKIVFGKILEKNNWLEPSTKKYALKKLDHLKFIIGIPGNLREDPDLNYTDNLYDNLIKIYKWRHQQFIDLEGKQVIDMPYVDWSQYPAKMTGSQAYIVNASYTPTKNAICINAGYIQKPFIDMDEKGIEYNLAHVGFTICHEMSHGFNQWGSEYGYDGKLHDWWTKEDKNKYKSIQNDVIKQYRDFASRDGINFDASIGIGEDLADISGLAICDEYLRAFQESNKDIFPIRYLSYKIFYTYFAFQQREFIDKKALTRELETDIDPHPLDKYRCNIPLSRSEIFRSIYNVKKGDGMWWHNTNTIW
jgi:predicted metalloendopeptidase